MPPNLHPHPHPPKDLLAPLFIHPFPVLIQLNGQPSLMSPKWYVQLIRTYDAFKEKKEKKKANKTNVDNVNPHWLLFFF
jgi:hypothetical protein